MRAKSGTVLRSGDAVQKEFKIAHGLDKKPEEAMVEVKEHKMKSVTFNTETINVQFVSAPPRGFENVEIYWRTEYIEIY